MELGEMIHNRRMEKQMTMEDLGKRIGKNKAFISRLESGKVKTLKYEMVKPLAKALEIPIQSFFDINNKKDLWELGKYHQDLYIYDDICEDEELKKKKYLHENNMKVIKETLAEKYDLEEISAKEFVNEVETLLKKTDMSEKDKSFIEAILNTIDK